MTGPHIAAKLFLIAALTSATHLYAAPAVEAQASTKSSPGTILKASEHKTVRHPSKQYFDAIWPNGLQVSFDNAFGHFATYEFPGEAFPMGEKVVLLSRGSPDLLPLHVVRIAANDYCIEWLADAPSKSAATRVVHSR